MSSHTLKAKNKKTGEIVEVIIPTIDTGVHKYQIKEGVSWTFYTEKRFNELYEVVEEKKSKLDTSSIKVSDHKLNEDTPFDSIVNSAPVEEWEKEFEDKFGDPMTKKYGEGFALYCSACNGKRNDEVKQFIKQTLQKERERIVAKIKIQIEFTRRSPNLRPVNQAAHIIEGLQKAIIIIENK